MTDTAVFSERFRRATGCDAYHYQRELGARAEPPAVVEVPTGSGKTMAALIPWLCDSQSPRRLVYALPMRSLVEQTAQLTSQALRRLGDDTPVHVLMGGVEPSDWRLDVDRRAVIVGTIDMLLSRALNRGYSESRFAWPVAFGLLNNDCRWIFDEVPRPFPRYSARAATTAATTSPTTTPRRWCAHWPSTPTGARIATMPLLLVTRSGGAEGPCER